MPTEDFSLHKKGCKEGKRPVWIMVGRTLKIATWPCSFWWVNVVDTVRLRLEITGR